MHCLQIFKHAYSNRAKLSVIEIISANLIGAFHCYIVC